MRLIHQSTLLAALLALVLGCAACGGSTSGPTANSDDTAGSSPPPNAAADSSTNTDTDTGTRDGTPAGAGDATLTIDYTSAKGWHYSGDLPTPQYTVSFSSDTSSSPPGSARLSTSVEGAPATSGRDEIDTGLTPDNPGRPNGPSLVMVVQIAYKIATTSPGLQAGPCSTEGQDSSEDVTSGRQIGLPFAYDMVCDPYNHGGSISVEGATGDMPQEQVESLVTELNGEQPTYVLKFGTSDINDDGRCIVFLTASHLHKLAQSEIPTGSDLTTSSECGDTTISLTQ